MMLTPEELLNAYTDGCFPMANSAEDTEFDIYEPKERSILPIRNLHIPKSLRKIILRSEFEIRVDTAFDDVIRACGETTPERQETWINQSIKNLFNQLHGMGHAHSVEAWKDGQLVGGLYGLQIGAAFCGESMFSRVKNSSKVALVHLAARLNHAGFDLLDAQFKNPHLEQFGQIIISQDEYLARLGEALKKNPVFQVAKPENDLVRDYILK